MTSSVAAELGLRTRRYGCIGLLFLLLVPCLARAQDVTRRPTGADDEPASEVEAEPDEPEDEVDLFEDDMRPQTPDVPIPAGPPAPPGTGAGAVPTAPSFAPVEARSPTAVALRIKDARDLAQKQRDKLPDLKAMKVLTDAAVDDYRTQLDAWREILSTLGSRLDAARPADPADAKAAKLYALAAEGLSKELEFIEAALASIGERLAAAEKRSGWDLVGTLLRARCQTAICFDNGDAKDWLGIEPLVELPVGYSMSLSDSGLGDYVNNHDLRIDLAAGIRVWIFRDIVSLSLYLSKPLTDAPIRMKGSSFPYPATSVKRPYPGIAVGALFDSLWIAFDRNELRNGDGQDGAGLNPAYPPNEVISSTWTLTVALEPVTAFRTAIGSAVQSGEAAP